jgi:hypothetical protein
MLRSRLVQSPLLSRLERVLRRYAGPAAAQQDRLRAAIPFFIAVASIASAFVGWRAAVYSSDAGELDRRATQALIRERQIRAEFEGEVKQDLRLFAAYQEHVLMWRLLERDALRVRRRDPGLAAELDAQAQSERAAARAIAPQFRGQSPGVGDENGIVDYDRRAALAFIGEELSPSIGELEALSSEPTTEDAHRKRTTSVNLFGVAALFVAALFFLTLAQLGRAVNRQTYFSAGVAVLVLATLLFHWIGP